MIQRLTAPLSKLAIGFSLIVFQGCVTTYATLQVLAEEEGTKKPIVGEVFMADSNRYIGITPLTYDISQKGYREKPVPLLFKTPCGVLYYEIFLVDKWSENQLDTDSKFNSYLFSIKSDEECLSR